jgi:hypothetical protein
MFVWTTNHFPRTKKGSWGNVSDIHLCKITFQNFCMFGNVMAQGYMKYVFGQEKSYIINIIK